MDTSQGPSFYSDFEWADVVARMRRERDEALRQKEELRDKLCSLQLTRTVSEELCNMHGDIPMRRKREFWSNVANRTPEEIAKFIENIQDMPISRSTRNGIKYWTAIANVQNEARSAFESLEGLD